MKVTSRFTTSNLDKAVALQKASSKQSNTPKLPPSLTPSLPPSQTPQPPQHAPHLHQGTKHKFLSTSNFDNISNDKLVGFNDEGHTYTLISDPSFEWTSVTSVSKPFKEEFDSEYHAKRLSKKKSKAEYYGRPWKEIAAEWDKIGKEASQMGTDLHAYGEKLLMNPFNKSLIQPDSPKAAHVLPAINHMYSQGYELAMTEILVYNQELGIVGQSDILLKKPWVYDNPLHFTDTPQYDYMIYDWKFLSKPLQKKSFFNIKTRKYTNMKGPFRYLPDSNWIHYSIQLAIYQTLTGQAEKVTEKVLVVVTDDKFELIPCYPMRVYWDSNKKLQAVYERWDGKWYSSATNALYSSKPSWAIGV